MDDLNRDDEFIKSVDAAYNLLWKMHETGEWDDKRDEKLVNILNAIDNELGR